MPAAFLLHPWSHALGSKTNERDVSVPLDLERQAFLVPLLLALRRRRGEHASLFGLSYQGLRESFRAAVVAEDVGILAPSLYGLRHGGASHDRAAGSRPLQEVQQRGAWRAHSSVTRYDKHGRLSFQLARLGPQRVLRLENVTADFESVFTRLFWASLRGQEVCAAASRSSRAVHA